MAIHVVVSGHIGRDAETRPAGGATVVSFSLASSAFRKKEKCTDWVNISMFGQRAEKLCQYLTKGAPVTVRGELHVREYDAKDGSKKFSIEVKADDIELMGSKSKEGGSSGGGGSSSRQQSKPRESAPADDFGGAGGGDDDVPFASCNVTGGERWWR